MILTQFTPVISHGFFTCLHLLSLCTSASYPRKKLGIETLPLFIFLARRQIYTGWYLLFFFFHTLPTSQNNKINTPLQSGFTGCSMWMTSFKPKNFINLYLVEILVSLRYTVIVYTKRIIVFLLCWCIRTSLIFHKESKARCTAANPRRIIVLS